MFKSEFDFSFTVCKIGKLYLKELRFIMKILFQTVLFQETYPLWHQSAFNWFNSIVKLGLITDYRSAFNTRSYGH